VILIGPPENRGIQIPPELVDGRTLYLGEDLYDIVDDWELKYSGYSGDFVQNDYPPPLLRIIAVGDERPNFTYSDFIQRQIQYGLVQYVYISRFLTYEREIDSDVKFFFRVLVKTFGREYSIIERPRSRFDSVQIPIILWRIDECTVVELRLVTDAVDRQYSELNNGQHIRGVSFTVEFFQDCDYVDSMKFVPSEIYTRESLELDSLLIGE
jgi:hypothetical protein